MNMGFVPGATSSDVMGLFLRDSGGRLRDNICIGWGRVYFASLVVNVSCSTTAGRIWTIALVADWSLTDNLSIDVGLRVGADIGGATAAM